MKNEENVHVLVKELIPILDDVDARAKEIVIEHIEQCEECHHIYEELRAFDEHMPKLSLQEEQEMKPLKKLVQFNRGLKLLVVGLRALILFYVLYTSVGAYDWGSSVGAAVSYAEGVTFMFYLPAAVFLNIFSLVFFSRRWVWSSVVFDLIVVLFIGTIIGWFY
ncbi:hypothetical protein LCM20_12505 [Halobacillus litoralis]|uniref:hypothetical protein n=1 Tax=Halobacillus litoralis TaxID=45668 RepID=UPI001CD20E8E|nr:hypothetical protein [Halobacillus litoralis]MCA0971418.1 hypothetical protein [Halobacillus litoralis]